MSANEMLRRKNDEFQMMILQARSKMAESRKEFQRCGAGFAEADGVHQGGCKEEATIVME